MKIIFGAFDKVDIKLLSLQMFTERFEIENCEKNCEKNFSKKAQIRFPSLSSTTCSFGRIFKFAKIKSMFHAENVNKMLGKRNL
eukprot:UN07829